MRCASHYSTQERHVHGVGFELAWWCRLASRWSNHKWDALAVRAHTSEMRPWSWFWAGIVLMCGLSCFGTHRRPGSGNCSRPLLVVSCMNGYCRLARFACIIWWKHGFSASLVWIVFFVGKLLSWLIVVRKKRFMLFQQNWSEEI